MVEVRPPDNVFPLGGHRLPPPPGWEEPEQPLGKNAYQVALTDEDLTADGQIRCVAMAKVRGERCTKPAVPGLSVCRYHGGGGVPKHPDDPAASTHGATVGRARVLEAARRHLEGSAAKAARALDAMLEDESLKASDRLKAIELVLDRTVGKQIAIEKADNAKRDLDAEILELVRQQTGTDG